MKDSAQFAGVGCLSIVAVLIFMTIVWGIVLFGFGLRVATAGIVGRGQAHIQIQSGSNRIAQYDKFFNECASIQGLEGQIKEQQNLLGTAVTEADRSRISANLAGVAGLRHIAIAQYNANARKNYTDGQFRDSDLPFQISDGGNATSCGS